MVQSKGRVFFGWFKGVQRFSNNFFQIEFKGVEFFLNIEMVYFKALFKGKVFLGVTKC